jgi:pSer/pThr/pTyr-binding forkhead associated (FHA) protein
MAICSHCGREARPGDRFCQYCGQVIESEQDVMATSEPSPVYAMAGAPPDWNGQQQASAAPRASTGPLGTAATPQARLVVRISPTAEAGAVVDDGEREFLLDGRDIAIGRAPSCDIVLAGDQLASRRHALLRVRDNTYTIVDLGSSNGTYINDEEIHAETPLRDGDRVTVGGHDLVFSTTPASPSASVAGASIEPSAHAASGLLETSPSVSAINLPVPVSSQAQADAPLAEPEQLEVPAEAEVAAPAEAPADEAGAPPEAEEPQQMEQEEADVAAPESGAEESDVASVSTADWPVVPAGVVAQSPAATDVPAASATAEDAGSADAGNTDLDALREQLAEISTALSRKADEEYRLAGRLRAALVEVRDQLATLAREHGGGSYGTPEAEQDYSQLANIARQAADHPRHLDYLSSLADSAGEIADALEAKQSSMSSDSGDLLADIEALRARLDETLG